MVREDGDEMNDDKFKTKTEYTKAMLRLRAQQYGVRLQPGALIS